MAKIYCKSSYLLRRDTAANWNTKNPILREGEEGYETDTGKRKVGNGTTEWNNLKYDSGIVDQTYTPESENAQSGKAVSEAVTTEQKRADNVFSNALKGSKSGSAILIDDVSPVTHDMRVKVKSKNLIPYPYYNFPLEQNGITATLGNDGSITLNGTATENADFRIYENTNGTKRDFIVKPGINYTVSGIPNGASTYTYRLRITTTNDNAHDFVDNSYTQQFNITEDTAIKWVFVTVRKGVTVNNLVFKPQLELGTTATAYTPYVPDLTAVTVSRCGKNLFTFQNRYQTHFGAYTNTTKRDFKTNPNAYYFKLSSGNYYVINTDGFRIINDNSVNMTTTDHYGLGVNFKVRPNETYTVSYKELNDERCQVNVDYYDENGNWLSQEKDICTFTIPENCYWMVLCFVAHVSDGSTKPINITFSNIQLELGSTATEYEPYKECAEYTPTADGTVNGVTSLYPNTTLMTDTEGVIIDCVYNRDINKAFAELQQAVLSMGGNT